MRRGRPWTVWAAPCRATLPSAKSVSAAGGGLPCSACREPQLPLPCGPHSALLMWFYPASRLLTCISQLLRAAVNRHRSLAPLLGKAPSVGHGAFVAPSAAVIGDVRLGSQASVFYGSVVRGEVWVQAAATSGLAPLCACCGACMWPAAAAGAMAASVCTACCVVRSFSQLTCVTGPCAAADLGSITIGDKSNVQVGALAVRCR